MDNAMMIGLSRQMILRRSMDIAANNIANVETPGFKAEQLLLEAVQPSDAETADGASGISYVQDWGVMRDFRDGALTQTGRPLDVAIEGEGFFTVQGEDGPLYSRDGRFAVDGGGRLVTADGRAVLDEGGGEIALDVFGSEPVIRKDGAVTVDGAEIARLGVVRFETLTELEKVGDGRYRAPEDAAPQAVEIPTLRQGFVEGSNVNSVMELTNLIEISRAYGSVTRMIEDASQLHRDAIRRLGDVNV